MLQILGRVINVVFYLSCIVTILAATGTVPLAICTLLLASALVLVVICLGVS